MFLGRALTNKGSLAGVPYLHAAAAYHRSSSSLTGLVPAGKSILHLSLFHSANIACSGVGSLRYRPAVTDSRFIRGFTYIYPRPLAAVKSSPLSLSCLQRSEHCRTMALDAVLGLNSPVLGVAFVFLALLATAYAFLFARPSLPKNAPPLVTEAWPLIGSMQFFTQRWDFFQRQMAHSPNGNFSFWAGDKPVIGLSGDESRRIFFEHRHLGFSEGYGALLGGSPKINKNNELLAEAQEQEDGFGAYFAKRLGAMLKGPILAKGLPELLQDVRSKIDKLADQEDKVTDPFDSIYRIVFQITMRTVACNEIAGDELLLEKVLKLYETIESTATPLSIMYNWMPVPARFRRTYAGARLYMIFKNIIDTRAKEGRREDDTLQYLIDQGDDITKIITFVLGALFAGQLNSGVNAAWMIVYLSNNQHWLQLAREEVQAVADRHCPDSSLALVDRLMQVPIEAWESEFPTIDLCLKETIRMQLAGSAFRKNISGRPIPLNKDGTEVIPPDAYAAFAVADIHYNPEIYTDHNTWDPSRYLPGREEDKKKQYGWIGWGVSRHPCLGMRFAKLENNIITAFWVAQFEGMETVDSQGKKMAPPSVNQNAHSAHKPSPRVFVNYQLRKA